LLRFPNNPARPTCQPTGWLVRMAQQHPLEEAKAMDVAREIVEACSRFVTVGLGSRFNAYRAWPSRAILIDEPLALAEAQTSRLRRIYEKCGNNLWDGPALFRAAVAKHGGIQLDEAKRRALARPISILMW